VWLPCGEPDQVVEARPQSPGVDLRGRGVVVLDDQEYVREVVAGMLRRLGCQVRTVADGAQALELARQDAGCGRRPELFLLDLTNAGGMGGRQALEALRAADPRVAAVAVSGHAEDPIMERPGAYGFGASLRKPFTLEELAEALRRALQAAGAPVVHDGSPGAA